jgi:predicted RNase H-like nuclease (RuvC/YqgF family)
MVKLTNKQHEIQQLARIKKLENDLKQQKNRIDTLENRIKNLEQAKLKK